MVLDWHLGLLQEPAGVNITQEIIQLHRPSKSALAVPKVLYRLTLRMLKLLISMAHIKSRSLSQW